jgi:hypothetical protein
MWVEDCQDGRRRWVAYQYTSRCYFMEVGLHGDVDTSSPVSTYIHEDASSARMAQELIWTDIGQESHLQIYKQKLGSITFYRIGYKQETTGINFDLGKLSLQPINDMKHIQHRLSKGKSTLLPDYWNGLHVVAVVTEVLPPYPEHVHEPYASSGFCLGLRLRGMDFIYKGYKA